jgi:hypothetical protein
LIAVQVEKNIAPIGENSEAMEVCGTLDPILNFVLGVVEADPF